MNTTEFKSTSGRLVSIKIDDSGENIIVSQSSNEIGRISLQLISGDLPMPDVYLITELSLEACKREGIGRKCLEFQIELFNLPIVAGPDDGSRPDNGSYLIGDGPTFIKKMISEKLIRSRWDSSYCEGNVEQ